MWYSIEETYPVDPLDNLEIPDSPLMIQVYKQNQHEYQIDEQLFISVILT